MIATVPATSSSYDENSLPQRFDELSNPGHLRGRELRYIYRHVVGLVEVLIYPTLQLFPLLVEVLGGEVSDGIICLSVRSCPVRSLLKWCPLKDNSALLLNPQSCLGFTRSKGSGSRIRSEVDPVFFWGYGSSRFGVLTLVTVCRAAIVVSVDLAEFASDFSDSSADDGAAQDLTDGSPGAFRPGVPGDDALEKVDRYV